MKHIKRHSAPKTWPVVRKGTKFIAKPTVGFSNSLPLVIILRDLLKVAQNKKEVKKMIHFKSILLNGRNVRHENEGVMLFDIITLVPSKKYYKLIVLKTGKLNVEEIKESESNTKIVKIINKKTLNGKKTQLNLGDGRNFLSEIKCKVNDSVLVNLKTKKIEKCIQLNEKSKVLIFTGKHSGSVGKIENIDNSKKMVEINTGEEKINVLIKQIMVIE